MAVSEVAHLSEEYWQCAELREEILRKPLGLCFERDKLVSETLPQRHFAAWIGDDLAGCAVLTPLDRIEARVRSVAVAPGCQRRGVGTALMVAATQLARALGFRRIVLDARLTAQAFYEKLGYDVDGSPFMKVRLPHVRMTREI